MSVASRDDFDDYANDAEGSAAADAEGYAAADAEGSVAADAEGYAAADVVDEGRWVESFPRHRRMRVEIVRKSA